jgi:hypothetical protein
VAVTTTSHQVATVCGNCDAPLHGAFCHACGQRSVGPEVGLHDVFHEAIHEFAHVDGKIVQTLRLLLGRPGMLTKEFLAGRRARFVSPLRLYLTCSLVFFALAALAPEAQPFFRVTKVDHEAQLDPATVQQRRADASAVASHEIVHVLPRAMFVLMPAFALLTWALYRRARPFYAAHLYYAIHFHAFLFIALTFSLIGVLGGGRYGWPVSSTVPWLILGYHYVSLRRVFGGSWRSTAWKGTVISIAYVALLLATVLVIGLRSLRGIG